MKKSFIVTAVVLAAVQCLPANGQILTSSPLTFSEELVKSAATLTFEQALEMAYTRSEQLKAARFNEQNKVQLKKATAGLRSPQLGLSAAYTYMSDRIAVDFNSAKGSVSNILGTLPLPIPPSITQPLMATDWALEVQKRDFAVVGGSFKMPIYLGGKLNAANRAAKLQIYEAKEQTNQQVNALYSELVERYYGLSLAQQVVKVRRDVLEGMLHHLSDAQKLEANGMIARVERLFAEMHVAKAEQELKKAESDVQTILTALNNTLSREGGDVTPMSSMFMVTDIQPVDYFKGLAMSSNPLLQQVELKEKLAQEAVKVARSAFIPEVAAMGAINIYDYQLTKYAPRWAVGAGLKFNIFDGLNREYKFSAAKSQVKQVGALNEKAQKDIATLVEKVYNEMINQYGMVTTAQSTIAFAEEYLRVKNIAFAEGTASSSDVVDARLNLAKARIERLQAAYTFDVSLARLLETCGCSDRFAEYKAKPSAVAVYYDRTQALQ